MEPDAENHELEICEEHHVYCHWVTSPNGTKTFVTLVMQQNPLDGEILLARIPGSYNTPDKTSTFLPCKDMLVYQYPRLQSSDSKTP